VNVEGKPNDYVLRYCIKGLRETCNGSLWKRSICLIGLYKRDQQLAKGWTVRESNPGRGEIFRTCPDRPWGPPSLLYNEYRIFPGGKKRSGRDADPAPPSSAVAHERVQLYLYSPYGPYGLYRASVPVQGCTLPIKGLRETCNGRLWKRSI